MLDGITDSMDMSLSKLQEVVEDRKPGVLQSMGLKELDMTEWLSNNTTTSKDTALPALLIETQLLTIGPVIRLSVWAGYLTLEFSVSHIEGLFMNL